jgi:hypothetical protein
VEWLLVYVSMHSGKTGEVVRKLPHEQYRVDTETGGGVFVRTELRREQ